ncbi:MAG: HNH endonuclease [Candidatus Contendobacter sp.]|nr:HNH endonuclease [Candidatus Contendobacter sp.]
MYGLEQQILHTDITGMPLEWIDYQQAVRLYHAGQVAYTCGRTLYTVHGGVNARSGRRSAVTVNSIIATQGGAYARLRARQDYTPPLSNAALFRRDCNTCLYCGETFSVRDLSRDHIRPIVQGGGDRWNNVVTACKPCNHAKGGKTPEQAGMQLLAIPFTPNHAEYVFLQGRRVLVDQMDFLRAHFPRTSPLHQRLARLS